MKAQTGWYLLPIDSFPITLTQSRYWWQSKNIDWFIENAEFAFRKSNPIAYKERRLWIKTKVRYNHEDADCEPLNFNCFEFDTDIHGIIIKCETWFFQGTPPNDDIIDKDFNVKRAFVKYLHKEEDEYGGGELKFLNPNLLRRLSNFKSKHIKIK